MVIEVIHLVHNLIIMEDVNSYQLGSHLRYILQSHTWKIEMQKSIDEVEDSVAMRKLKFLEILHGLELIIRFLEDSFKDQVPSLGPPLA